MTLDLSHLTTAAKEQALQDAPTRRLLQDELAEHRRTFEATATMLTRPFVETLNLVENAIRRGGKVLLFGNGGSAADAQHIAA